MGTHAEDQGSGDLVPISGQALIENAIHHIGKIRSIAEKARINPSAADPQNLVNGFLVYVLDSDQYVQRSIDNDFFITLSVGNSMIGYLMSYSRNFLNKLVDSGSMRHEDGIMNMVLNHSESEDNFLFIDQIAIEPESRKKNAGTILMQAIFEKMKEKNMCNIYLAIMHHPIRNQASIKFMKRLGFNSIGETSNQDHFVWGIYHVDISKG